MSKGLEDKIVKAYYEYMVDIAVIYGADRNRAEQELMESLEFEMKLANVSCRTKENLCKITNFLYKILFCCNRFRCQMKNEETQQLSTIHLH